MIIDNDEQFAEQISLTLKKEYYETLLVSDSQNGLSEFRRFNPDMILLGVLLPGTDGYQVCRQIRGISHVPIIMLSSKTEVIDRVLGLELGADDYIQKPFDTKELSARIKALFRRVEWSTQEAASKEAQAKSLKSNQVVRFPDLTINLDNYAVTFHNKTLDMPPKEIELLYFLASSPNQVFTREQLLQHIWGYDYVGDTRTVDVHIKRLREKLSGSTGWTIGTVWGVGYRFSTH